MSLLTKIQSTINLLERRGEYTLAAKLYPIATDAAFIEEQQYLINQFKKAHHDLNSLKSNLETYGFITAASDVDIIQRDIEAKLISFSKEDPISSVLSSYKILHKLASAQKNDNNLYKTLEQIVQDESLPEAEIIKSIQGLLLGLPEQEKASLVYQLEKDYNLTFPLQKIAKEKDKKQQEDECLLNAESLEEREKCIVPKKSLKMHHSYPTSPSIWSGWSYESPVPYQQQNQLNFWSLAGLKPFTKRS